MRNALITSGLGHVRTEIIRAKASKQARIPIDIQARSSRTAASDRGARRTRFITQAMRGAVTRTGLDYRRIEIIRATASKQARIPIDIQALSSKAVEKSMRWPRHHIALWRTSWYISAPLMSAWGVPSMKLLAANSNRPLSEAIAGYLKMPLADATVHRFADMELFVEIHENVRGQDVFLVQSTSYPANDNLMELLVCIDALKRASARRITAVMPYFGYARQDRKTGSRAPISAKLVANLITQAGANRVLTMDLHAGQIQGFFDIPVDNLYASPLMAKDIQERYDQNELLIVSPDVGPR